MYCINKTIDSLCLSYVINHCHFRDLQKKNQKDLDNSGSGAKDYKRAL